LQEFKRFVKENPEHIEAREILINRRKDFDAGQLKSLKQTLSAQPDNLVDKFTEKNLRRAYNREFADIISMIRHAATGGELLTTEQRVNKAFMKVKSDRSFNEQQEKWLELIKRHLLENLLMEKEDMDYLPIFTREGASWGKLNKVFNDDLETIIPEINQAIAA
jgi:type I restriction enzyme R subunit